MFSLSLNSMLFIILGIFVLTIALLVVYIETKTREQNHKIGSMLSLVSSLAEELNSIKFQRGGGITNEEQNSLVTVSDGDDETLGDIEDDDEDEDDNSVIEVDNLDGTDISNTNTNNIKILKLTLTADEYETVTSDNESDTSYNESATSDNESATSDNDLEELDDLEDLEDLEDEDVEEEQNVSLFDLKSINISNLEENKPDSIELRKQPVNKLRSIVAEKGLAADPSKLKKPELLKLLGAE